MREVLPSGDEEALETASTLRLVRIPDKGFINFRPGIQGRGDGMATVTMIFSDV